MYSIFVTRLLPCGSVTLVCVTRGLSRYVRVVLSCVHVSFGKARTREMAADPGARPVLQQAVDDLVSFTVPFFGRSTSANNESFRRWRVKRRTNDQARSLWAERCRSFVEGELGLMFPPVDVRWDG